MSQQSTIEWTDATWNPVTGCTEVSPGCDHCYARSFAERFRGVPNHPYEQGFDLRLWYERLELPLRWKKPRRIFTNSMSDLFHKDVPDDFILQVFAVMAKANWHNFQVLTKRPARLARLAPKITKHLAQFTPQIDPWPAHIWLGVSVETIQYRWRVNHLRNVPAQVRFISAEPLLGSLDKLDLTGIHWLIAGGESGRGHRPCNVDWVRGLRDRCQGQDVAFFFKQWGGRTPKAGGRELDGRTWDQFPDLIHRDDKVDSPNQEYQELELVGAV
jgi:protein gp37